MSVPKLIPGSVWPLKAVFRDKATQLPHAGGVSGWSVRLVIKDDPTKPDAEALFDETTVGAGDDAAASLIRTPVHASVTQTFSGKSYIWVQMNYWTPGNEADPRTIWLQRLRMPTVAING